MRIKAVAAVVAITVASVLVPHTAHASHCWDGWTFIAVPTPATHLYIELVQSRDQETATLFVRVEDGKPGYQRGNRQWPVDPRDHGLPSPLTDPPCSTDDGDRVLFWAGIEDEG